MSAEQRLAALVAELQEISATLEPHEDADHNGAGFVPNAAMRARQAIAEAVRKATAP